MIVFVYLNFSVDKDLSREAERVYRMESCYLNPCCVGVGTLPMRLAIGTATCEITPTSGHDSYWGVTDALGSPLEF
jgi:hypothetical protein